MKIKTASRCPVELDGLQEAKIVEATKYSIYLSREFRGDNFVAGFRVLKPKTPET